MPSPATADARALGAPRGGGPAAVPLRAVTGRPSRLRRALRAVAFDAGLLRRRRDYRLLVTGQFVSLAGSELTFVAVPFQTFKLTGSSLAVGLLGIAEFAPILALALVGGALADAVDRRRLVALAEGGAAVVAALLVVNALLPAPQLWALYAGAGAHRGVHGAPPPAAPPASWRSIVEGVRFAGSRRELLATYLVDTPAPSPP